MADRIEELGSSIISNSTKSSIFSKITNGMSMGSEALKSKIDNIKKNLENGKELFVNLKSNLSKSLSSNEKQTEEISTIKSMAKSKLFSLNDLSKILDKSFINFDKRIGLKAFVEKMSMWADNDESASSGSSVSTIPTGKGNKGKGGKKSGGSSKPTGTKGAKAAKGGIFTKTRSILSGAANIGKSVLGFIGAGSAGVGAGILIGAGALGYGAYYASVGEGGQKTAKEVTEAKDAGEKEGKVNADKLGLKDKQKDQFVTDSGMISIINKKIIENNGMPIDEEEGVVENIRSHGFEVTKDDSTGLYSIGLKKEETKSKNKTVENRMVNVTSDGLTNDLGDFFDTTSEENNTPNNKTKQQTKPSLMNAMAAGAPIEAVPYTDDNGNLYTSIKNDAAVSEYNSANLNDKVNSKEWFKTRSEYKDTVNRIAKSVGVDSINGFGFSTGIGHFVVDSSGKKHKISTEDFYDLNEKYQNYVESDRKSGESVSRLERAKSNKINLDKDIQTSINVASALSAEGYDDEASNFLDSVGIKKIEQPTGASLTTAAMNIEQGSKQPIIVNAPSTVASNTTNNTTSPMGVSAENSDRTSQKLQGTI